MLPAIHVSGYPPALASYDGRLHAVYSTPENALRHTTWTAKDGWADGEDVEGRESEEMPALLVFKDGPAGGEREALLLVNRGVEHYVPPAPPEPPVPPAVATVVSRGTTVSGGYHRDHSAGGWSRITHRVSLTPATLNNGNKAVIATWEATAEYDWGSGYYPENYDASYKPSISRGTLRLKKKGDTTPSHHKDFRGSFDSDGRFRHDVLIPDLDPGDYELYLSTNTKKEGGYWQNSKAALSEGEKDSSRYTRIADFSRATVTATV
ncbi:hypothetical protein ACFVZH_09130 [Streptomyces sp. NPDC059534]|uniref:hypothetical protein n=1 Tax=Streptomyces sp. NPDC059534 TaxID=3346859 RepID=UPI0036C63C7E